MTIGPAGIPASVSGSQLAQTQGTDVERSQAHTASQTRASDGEQRAEQAAGIGRTEQDHETEDRDADGRRPWEWKRRPDRRGEEENDSRQSDREPQSRDASGQSGNYLDVSG